MRQRPNALHLPRFQVFHREVSLIELFISCGIILIVLMLMLPTVSASVSSNKNQQCISNLKSLQSAVGLYVQDNDETLPLAWSLTKQEDKEVFSNWRKTLLPYIKTLPQGKAGQSDPDLNPVYHCEADKYGPAYVSYALNALITGYQRIDEGSPSTKLSNIPYPEQVIFLGDTNKNWKRGEGFYDTIADWIRPSMDLGVPNNDNRAVMFYYRWLKERDWTDLTATALDCPDGIFRCKYPSFHHERTGKKSGYAHFLMVDGHLGVFRWGQANVENIFPVLTPEQMELTHKEGN